MNFSIWALFAGADIVVQCVMLVLVAASFIAWYIFFAKLALLRRLHVLSSVFEGQLWQGRYTVEKLYTLFGKSPKDPFANLFRTGVQELSTMEHAKGSTLADQDLVRSHLENVLGVLAQREIQALQQNTTFLASIASTSPFVGLFGTVWGIMGSFEAIAKAGNTSLTIVAPAISEALFATALGLFVAIPATLCYNKLASDLSQYHIKLQTYLKQLSLFLMKEFVTKGVRLA